MSRLKGDVFQTSYPYLDYSYSQNVAGNYTDISFSFGMHFGPDSNFRTDQRTLNFDSPVGSGSFSFGPTGTGPYPEGSTNDEVTYKSGTFRITHDASGHATASVSFSVFKTYSGSATLNYSGTLTLPTIPRQPSAPGTPSQTGATDSDPTTTTLTWTAPTNVGAGLSQRQIQVSTSSAFSSTVIDSTAAWGTSFNATGLHKGTTYYARVRASSSAGFGPYSGTRTFTTGTTVPGAPPAPTAGSVDYTHDRADLVVSVRQRWHARQYLHGAARDRLRVHHGSGDPQRRLRHVVHVQRPGRYDDVLLPRRGDQPCRHGRVLRGADPGDQDGHRAERTRGADVQRRGRHVADGQLDGAERQRRGHHQLHGAVQHVGGVHDVHLDQWSVGVGHARRR